MAVRLITYHLSLITSLVTCLAVVVCGCRVRDGLGRQLEQHRQAVAELQRRMQTQDAAFKKQFVYAEEMFVRTKTKLIQHLEQITATATFSVNNDTPIMGVQVSVSTQPSVPAGPAKATVKGKLKATKSPTPTPTPNGPAKVAAAVAGRAVLAPLLSLSSNVSASTRVFGVSYGGGGGAKAATVTHTAATGAPTTHRCNNNSKSKSKSKSIPDPKPISANRSI
jgi:hypothetical protein